MRKSPKFFRVISAVVLLSFLALAILTAGCSSSAGSPLAMMEKLPWDTSQMTYVNVKALRSDPALEDLYGLWRQSMAQIVNTHGIDRNMVHAMALGSNVTLITGKFDLSGVRQELDKRDYDEGQYRGVEVWRKPYGNELTALMDRLIIIGPEDTVKVCIRIINDGDDSFSDRQHARDVLSKLPNGLYVNVSMSNWLTGLFLSGFKSLGISAQKADEYTLRFTFVLKFDEPRYAENAVNRVEDFVKISYRNVKASQDGEYVIVTGEIDIDDADSVLGKW